jgi:hypothetical protein
MKFFYNKILLFQWKVLEQGFAWLIYCTNDMWKSIYKVLFIFLKTLNHRKSNLPMLQKSLTTPKTYL